MRAAPHVDIGASGVAARGRYRYYSLAGPNVARVLEALSVVAGGTHGIFSPTTPKELCPARTCYDHMAGHWAVALRARFEELAWLVPHGSGGGYELTPAGSAAFAAIGIDIGATRALRRRFAYPCLDWSERKPHLGGALGHALLEAALRQRWFLPELDSRALRLTAAGRRHLRSRFGLHTPAEAIPA